MKVGIIGSGEVGRTLAGGFLEHGHSVMLGTRNPAQLGEWLAENPAARVGGFAQASGFAEVIVLAVKGTASERRIEGLYNLRRVSHGTASARISSGSICEGLQFGRQQTHDQSTLSGWETDDVHLWKR